MVNPLKAALVQGASQEGGSAVDHAHRGKSRKYEERCAAEGITSLPLAVDTLGVRHSSALDTINRLGRQLVGNMEKEDQEVVRQLRQRLAGLMVRGNVAMIHMCYVEPPPVHPLKLMEMQTSFLFLSFVILQQKFFTSMNVAIYL